MKQAARGGFRDRKRDAEGDDALPPAEIGGPERPEPIRYGGWERKGRVIVFKAGGLRRPCRRENDPP